jgi:hypothetical protein
MEKLLRSTKRMLLLEDDSHGQLHIAGGARGFVLSK